MLTSKQSQLFVKHCSMRFLIVMLPQLGARQRPFRTGMQNDSWTLLRKGCQNGEVGKDMTSAVEAAACCCSLLKFHQHMDNKNRFDLWSIWPQSISHSRTQRVCCIAAHSLSLWPQSGRASAWSLLRDPVGRSLARVRSTQGRLIGLRMLPIYGFRAVFCARKP